MNNVIKFPQDDRTSAAVDRRGVFHEPPAHTHAVQFYESDAFLFDTVAEFLGAGLKAGDRLVVIATPEHRAGFVDRLADEGVEAAIAHGQLTLLDARETLAKFMAGDMPDPDLFRDVLERVIGKMQEGSPKARIRAYGEMVDLLWREGNPSGAIRLEELWNEAGERHEFALLCAYVMGNFYREGDAEKFMEVCRTHSHVIPTERFTKLDDRERPPTRNQPLAAARSVPRT